MDKTGKIDIFNASTGKVEQVEPVIKSDAEWKKILTPEQFDVMRKKGTEAPFSKQCSIPKSGKGMYQCAACGTDLFATEKKFDARRAHTKKCALKYISQTRPKCSKFKRTRSRRNPLFTGVT